MDKTSKANLVASRADDLPTKFASVFGQVTKRTLCGSLAESCLLADRCPGRAALTQSGNPVSVYDHTGAEFTTAAFLIVIRAAS